MKVEDNRNDKRKFNKMKKHLDKVSVKTPSNRKRKVCDTDILVCDSNFEEFERSLLSKLWKDVDDQNRVVWKVSILNPKIFNLLNDGSF